MSVGMLKPGWRRVKFGDVVKQVKDRVNPEESGLERHIAGEHMDTDDLKIRRWGEINNDYLGPAFHMRFQPGQVLYGSRRTYLRKVAVPDFEGICANTTFVLEPKDPNVLLPELLPFVMQTEAFHEHSVRQSRGSVNPYVNFSDLAWYEFGLPGLEEQESLVELLVRFDNVSEVYHHAKVSNQKLRESFIEEKMSSILKNVPIGMLGDYSDVRYGLTVNSQRRNKEKQVPYLRVANVSRGKIILDELKNIGMLGGDESYLLEEHDILVVEGHANPDELGRAAIWRSQIDYCLHQNHLIRVRCGESILPEYLLEYLNSSFGRKYFRQYAKSTSGLNTINSTVVKEVPIPLVSTDCQNSIVQTARSFYESENEISERLMTFLKMKKNVLELLV